MKTIWTYGILRRDYMGSNPPFGLEKEYWKGKAQLRDWQRRATSTIVPQEDDYVKGDLWEVPDSVEDAIARFETGAGWPRTKVVVEDKEGDEIEAIAYIPACYVNKAREVLEEPRIIE